MAWDDSFSTRADPSGRAAGVHDSAYGAHFGNGVGQNGGEPPSKKAKN
jgi:hypothetical protein